MSSDVEAALFTLRMWYRTKNRLPYVGCYFWKFRSLFDLVVSVLTDLFFLHLIALLAVPG